MKDEHCDGGALRLPNTDKPFVLETDGSIHALHAVLLQSEEDEEYPAVFYSQELNAPQCNYSTYERELLGIVKACDGFRVYLLVRESNIRQIILHFTRSSLPI